jgi:hypothetical protein
MDLSKLSEAELAAMAGEGAPSPFAGMDDAALAAIVGEDTAPAAAPAASAEPSRSPLETYGRVMGLGARTAYSGGLQGLSAAGTLGADAAINVAYGAKKLASKTGLVDAPDPANYYQGRGYLPTTEAVGEKIEKGLDAVGLPKPEGSAERIATAAGSGVASALSGAGLGKVVASGGSALAQRVGGFMAAQPEVQAAAGASSGAAAQGVTEMGGDSTAATVAGFLAGGATGAAGAKGRQRPRAAIPTTEDLRDAKSAAYSRAEAAGVQFTPDSMRDLERNVRGALPGEGIYLDTNAAARRVMDPLTRSAMPDASGQRSPVSLTRLDDIRRQAGATQKSLDPSERRTGTAMASHLDDFLDNVGPQHVAAGDATRGIEALREAQAGNRRFAKASALDVALDKAELRAASTGAGANGENTVRQNLRQIIQDPNSRAFRQFDAPERAAMRDIVEGSRTQNALRYAGKFAPTGNVSGMGALFAASQGYGAIPAVGIGARMLGDAMHRRKVNRLEALVKGGPGAGRRPSADYGANAARGAAQGFLAGPGAAARYR